MYCFFQGKQPYSRKRLWQLFKSPTTAQQCACCNSSPLWLFIPFSRLFTFSFDAFIFLRWKITNTVNSKGTQTCSVLIACSESLKIEKKAIFNFTVIGGSLVDLLTYKVQLIGKENKVTEKLNISYWSPRTKIEVKFWNLFLSSWGSFR